MNKEGSSLKMRVISGVLGGVALLLLWIYGHSLGLLAASVVAMALALYEYARMVFNRWRMPFVVSVYYWLVATALLTGMICRTDMALTDFALASVAFFTGGLWLSRGCVEVETLWSALGFGTFGLVYCVLLPFFAVRTIFLPFGPKWFLFMLLVVFFGDTFAYFGGRHFGHVKLMPQVSPNKTWVGALSGLIGSCLAGVIDVRVSGLPATWTQTVMFCLVCGMVAQSGDLMISLVKRAAHVKDSGHIMPGHGGILDRLDGIFIACPLIYLFALYVRPL